MRIQAFSPLFSLLFWSITGKIATAESGCVFSGHGMLQVIFL